MYGLEAIAAGYFKSITTRPDNFPHLHLPYLYSTTGHCKSMTIDNMTHGSTDPASLISTELTVLDSGYHQRRDKCSTCQ